MTIVRNHQNNIHVSIEAPILVVRSFEPRAWVLRPVRRELADVGGGDVGPVVGLLTEGSWCVRFFFFFLGGGGGLGGLGV